MSHTLLLCTGALGSEVCLCGEDAAIGGFLAATGIWLSSVLVVWGVEVECSMKGERALEGDSLAGRAPQAQVDPAGLVFSVAARSQVHSPTGRAPIRIIRVSVMNTRRLKMKQQWEQWDSAEARAPHYSRLRYEGTYGKSSVHRRPHSRSWLSRSCIGGRTACRMSIWLGQRRHRLRRSGRSRCLGVSWYVRRINCK